MKTLVIACSLILAATAHAADKKTTTTTTTTTTAATTTATAPATASTPSQACGQLVEAAKAENFATVESLTLMPGRGPKKEHMKAEGKFKKMHTDYLAKIKGLTCGAEYVADGSAVVEAQAEGKKRLIPFTNENGNWKFNMQAYKALYDVEHAGHGKKM